MRTVARSYIQARLRKGIAALCPPEPEGLGQAPVEKARGDEWYLDGTRPRERAPARLVRLGAAAAACMLLICAAAAYLTGLRVDARIFLDINPSVELRVNSRERVVEAKALNEDGEVVLEGMELEGAPLDVAVNAVLGSTVKHGYLSQAQDWILLSVEGRDREKTEDLRARLTQGTQAYMMSLVGAGNIWNQSFGMDSAIEEAAARYGISPGKAALLAKLEAREPGLDLALLSKLSISELEEYLRGKGISLEDIISRTGGGADVKSPQTPSPSPEAASPNPRTPSPRPEAGPGSPSPAGKPSAAPTASQGVDAEDEDDDIRDDTDDDTEDDEDDEDDDADDRPEEGGDEDREEEDSGDDEEDEIEDEETDWDTDEEDGEEGEDIEDIED